MNSIALKCIREFISRKKKYQFCFIAPDYYAIKCGRAIKFTDSADKMLELIKRL